MTPTQELVPRFAVALALAATGVAGANASPARAATAPIQRLVVLERAHDAFRAPDPRSVRLTGVSAHRPITAARTVLPVLRETIGPDGRGWLRVMLPGRPNGSVGWISIRATSEAATAWHLRVDLSRRRVTVYRSGRPVKSFSAVVGKRATPTPRGRFFVEETVRLGSTRAGAPFALALSARSDVLQQFDGGPGQIALHGLGNVGGRPGTAVSHGCVRLERGPISWLAARIAPGVPVTITR